MMFFILLFNVLSHALTQLLVITLCQSGFVSQVHVFLSFFLCVRSLPWSYNIYFHGLLTSCNVFQTINLLWLTLPPFSLSDLVTLEFFSTKLSFLLLLLEDFSMPKWCLHYFLTLLYYILASSFCLIASFVKDSVVNHADLVYWSPSQVLCSSFFRPWLLFSTLLLFLKCWVITKTIFHHPNPHLGPFLLFLMPCTCPGWVLCFPALRAVHICSVM